MSEKMTRKERLLARQKEAASKSSKFTKVLKVPEDVGLFELEAKKAALFDIVPFIVTENHPNYKAIMKEAKQYGELPLAWCFPYTIHKGLKGLPQVVCRDKTFGGNEKCPVCEAKYQKMDEEGLEWDDKSLDEFRFSNRVAYVVCAVDGDDEDFHILDYPASWLHKDLETEANNKGILMLDESEEGYSVKVIPAPHSFTDNQGKTHTMAGQCIVDFVEREYGFTEEDLQDAPDLSSFFSFRSYDEIYAILHGLEADEEKDDEDDEIVEDKPSRKSSRRKAASKPEPEEEEVEEDDDDEEEEITKPSRRGSSRRTSSRRSTAKADTDDDEEPITF